MLLAPRSRLNRSVLRRDRQIVQTYTSQPDATDGIDAMIASDVPTTNFATRDILDIFDTPRSGLLKFNLAIGTNPPPANAIVSLAQLYLYNAQADAASTDIVMDIYPVLRAWVESQCTWNVYTTGNNWGTAGCNNTTTDREAVSIGATTWVNGEATATEHRIALTTEKVQAWVNGSLTNNGMLLRYTSGTGGFFPASSDHATATSRPKLVISYMLPL